MVATKGDNINIPHVANLTAGNINTGTGVLDASANTESTTQITIDKWKGCVVNVVDISKAQALPGYMDLLAKKIGYALGLIVETDLNALAASLSNNVGTFATELTDSDIRDAIQTLDGGNVPFGDRHMYLKHTVKNLDKLDEKQLDQALWNLSIILGRSYQETKDTFAYLEENKRRSGSNNGLFSLIFHLGKLIDDETVSRENALVIYLQPSLMNIIGQQRYGRVWAEDIKDKLQSLDLLKRPIHIISANMHSVVNLVYGFAAIEKNKTLSFENDLYRFIQQIRSVGEEINTYGETHGLTTVHDRSGTHIDCQIIDSARFESLPLHPEVCFALPEPDQEKPVIIVMDYAFGAQAFELMENLLKPVKNGAGDVYLNIQSISIMGKAGILTGKKGDIMLATAHVFEGTSDNYIFENDLHAHAFDSGVDVYTGPMVTVLGTSLQNRDVLHKFLEDWKTVGLEMEGGHYQRAISAAVIKGNISKDITLRYAYYGSDNPLMTGHTLAAGAMGEEGVKPTYMITKVLLKKIFCA